MISFSIWGRAADLLAAPLRRTVKELHCADLSAAFFEFLPTRTRRFPRRLLPPHRIRERRTAAWSGHFQGLQHGRVYTIFHYLTALNELLPTGGRLYFDYAEPDGIELGTGENFKAHSTGH